MVWVCLEYHIGQRCQCPSSSKSETKASFNLDDPNHHQPLKHSALCCLYLSIYTLLRASEIDDDWGIDDAFSTSSAQPRLPQIIPFNPKIFTTVTTIRKHYPLPSISLWARVSEVAITNFFGLQTHNYWDMFAFNSSYLSSPHSTSTEMLYWLIRPFL